MDVVEKYGLVEQINLYTRSFLGDSDERFGARLVTLLHGDLIQDWLGNICHYILLSIPKETMHKVL